MADCGLVHLFRQFFHGKNDIEACAVGKLSKVPNNCLKLLDGVLLKGWVCFCSFPIGIFRGRDVTRFGLVNSGFVK